MMSSDCQCYPGNDVCPIDAQCKLAMVPTTLPGYYWVRRINEDGEPIGEPRIAELRASYVTLPWRSIGGYNYGHEDIRVIARILPPVED